MVENSISKRKTPSTVSFCGSERFFESQAVVKFSRPTCDSFYMLNRFAETENNPFQKYLSNSQRFYYDNSSMITDKYGPLFTTNFTAESELKRNGLSTEVSRQLSNLNSSYFRFEELKAMMLETEKENAIKMNSGDATNAVFTIWDNSLSIAARKRLIAAYKIAGINPLALVAENTAAAVYFSMDRKSIKPSDNEIALFVNVGSSGTKLTLIAFHSANQIIGKNVTLAHPAITVIKDLFTPDFSGHLLDHCLAEFALQKQLKEIKRPLKPNEITLAKKRRLYNEVKRIKEILSVNKEIHFVVEDFFDDRPINIKITRTEFEDACKTHFDSLANILKAFMNEIKAAQYIVGLVEITGGSVRVPKVQEIIKEVTKLTPSTHINGDEGMAYGAALIASNLTAEGMEKKIILNDGPNYQIDVRLRFNLATGQQDRLGVLFPPKTNYGTRKTLNVPFVSNDFNLIVSQKDASYFIDYSISGIEGVIPAFKSRNVTQTQVDLNFELDRFGLPLLLNADLVIFESVSGQSIGANTGSVSQEPKIQRHVHQMVIRKVKESYLSLDQNSADFKASQLLLQSLKEIEMDRQRVSAIKNELEALVYKLNSAVDSEDLIRFMTVEEVEEFKKQSEKIDQTIFGSNSSHLKFTDFQQLLTETNDLTWDYNYRKHQFEKREANLEVWNEFQKNMTLSLIDYRATRQWIPEKAIGKLLSKMAEANLRVNETYHKQKDLPLNESPIFDVDFLVEQMLPLSQIMTKVETMTEHVSDNRKTISFDAFAEEALKKLNWSLNTDRHSTKEIEIILSKMKVLNSKNESGDGKNKNELETNDGSFDPLASGFEGKLLEQGSFQQPIDNQL